jgi:DedD protein
MAAEQDERDELRKKLLRRVAIAGALIVVLLGGLSLFEDALLERPAPAPPPPAPPPPPVAPAQTESPPTAPAQAEAPAAAQAQEAAAPERKMEEAAEPEHSQMPLAPPPKPAPRAASGPASAPAKPAQAATAGKAEAAASSARTDTAAPARGYRLQMGVFANTANAEELHAKLERAGIPSYIESRVHAGPFETRQQAEAARRKLKALGLGTGLLIPPQKR